mmetsp:Transcript_139302/g.253338  ORF Transcript_139302/g.253338 Transcript_139302/m.253338 type:complete len:496 (-) Transcript_139302:15-1502(-)
MAFQEELTAELQEQLPGFAGLLDAKRLSKGVSKEMWDLKLSMRASGSAAGVSKELRACLRRNPSAAAVHSLPLEVEAELCRLARAAGVPCPAILCEMSPKSRIGAAFLMEWIDGETLGHKILKDSRFSSAREGLARECGRALGKIHKIQLPRDGPAHRNLSTNTADSSLRRYWEMLRKSEAYCKFSRPALHFVFRWLQDRAPAIQGAPCLCHGDFRLGNLGVQEKGLAAVLDWELAEFGDPHMDLGWMLTMAWRYGQADNPVGGFGKLEDFIAGYQEEGHTVDEAHLKWWEIFSNVKWSVICLNQGVSFRMASANPENGTVGRRASEGELDALALILGPQPDHVFTGLAWKENNEAVHALHDGAGPTEGTAMMKAGQGLLEQMMAALPKGSHAEYLGRVCRNLLSITSRELQYGHWAAEIEIEELRALLGEEAGSNLLDLRTELSKRLQTTTFAETSIPELQRYLSRAVVRQLLFDNPKYFGLGQICSPTARPRL